MSDLQITRELFKQYTRTYDNFDKLMQCLYDITIFCKGQGNYTIAGIIEDCLNSLEVKN